MAFVPLQNLAGDRASFLNEIVEAALAQIVGDQVEQACRHSDLFEKRRRLMQQRCKFCAPLRRKVYHEARIWGGRSN
jgi:hypothetical protein